MTSRALFIIGLMAIPSYAYAQDYRQQYEDFKQKSSEQYFSFRDECNQKYVKFLRSAWSWFEGKAPLPLPTEPTPIPPHPYEDRGSVPIETIPIDISPIDEAPRPKPIEPIREMPAPFDKSFEINFFGAPCKVRLPEMAKLSIKDCNPNTLANTWEMLSSNEMNNAIRDCLEIRIRYNLCDWAYLLFIDQLCTQYCTNKNGATLLMSFLYCQSGYQMRLAVGNQDLTMLYGSKYQIFNKGYYEVDGIDFYPYGEVTDKISICNAEFERETPLSLLISKEQLFGNTMTNIRVIKSKQYPDVSIESQVPDKLIDFYDQYPTSAINNNPMTRWAMYANTPLSTKTKDLIYPTLRRAISGESTPNAANKLLNWVQTGFVYEYDDKVWGYDRAFFAEETLYYPYCDCEDRSILFSRLIRDLLGLEVALIYYPGHLATAVCFNEDVTGDAMIINGKRFVVCDPTYIGAPIGVQMPDLEYEKAQAIILGM